LITDSTYDKWAYELQELQENYPNESNSAVYAKEFKNFKACTGYDLPIYYPEIVNKAMYLLKICGKEM
jgi:hypothetical protein